jgi:hypothetical protein
MGGLELAKQKAKRLATGRAENDSSIWNKKNVLKFIGIIN